jgi:hypothetical protein
VAAAVTPGVPMWRLVNRTARRPLAYHLAPLASTTPPPRPFTLGSFAVASAVVDERIPRAERRSAEFSGGLRATPSVVRCHE